MSWFEGSPVTRLFEGNSGGDAPALKSIRDTQQTVGAFDSKTEGDESPFISLRGERDESVATAPARHRRASEDAWNRRCQIRGRHEGAASPGPIECLHRDVT